MVLRFSKHKLRGCCLVSQTKFERPNSFPQQNKTATQNCKEASGKALEET